MCWPVSCRWNTFSISTRIPGDQSEQLFVEMFQLWLEISLWTSWPQLRHSSSIAQTVWPSRVYQSKFSTLKVSQHMSEIRLFWYYAIIKILPLAVIFEEYNNTTLNNNKKPSWRWQSRATQKDAKIAPIWRVSFQFTEFHFPKFQITNA